MDDIKNNEEVLSGNIQITQHAYDRAKDRLSLSNKALERLANKAYSDGIAHSDTKGKLNRFITKKWMEYRSANNIRLYGENMFIFIDNRLITLYQLPNDLRKYVKFSK